MSFSSDIYPAADRFEMWREFFARNILRVDAATSDKSAFSARGRARKLPMGMNLLHAEMAPCSLTRTKALLSDGYDAMYFSICLGGTRHWQFGDRSIALGYGQAVLVPTGMLGGYRCDQNNRGLAVTLDRETVRGFGSSPDDLLMRPTAPGSEAVALLGAYCHALLRPGGVSTPNFDLLASRQIRELVAYALAPQSELARAEPFGGLKAARLCAVRNDVARHLHDDDLSVGAVAARQGVTPRYVQMLFEGEGTTFSQYVLGQRLGCAHRMLSDPRCADLTITAIALEAGFGDLAYFNRAFRRAYGMTPSDVRAAARPG